jgi:hypothetical protein
MYVGLYVAANRAREQFAEDDHHQRDRTGLLGWLLMCLKRLFLPKH